MATQTATNFLTSLREQKHGFSFGKPQRIGEKLLSVVLPIIRKTSIKRGYITFPETDKVMVFDTGKIDVMDAENQTDDHVFIRSGTLFRGATQERALQRSVVILSKTKSKLNVRCVHASRGINPGSSTKGSGDTIPLHMEKMSYSAYYKPKDQSEYWKNVQSSNTMMMRCVASNSVGTPISENPPSVAGPVGHLSQWGPYASHAKQDDLASNLDHFASTFDDMLSKVKIADDQAGLALINDGGVQTIEVFDHPGSWKAIHESAVKRMGTELLKEDTDNVFEFKPDNAIKSVDKVLGLDWKMSEIFNHRPSNGEPSILITGMSASGYVGEVVELDGTVIHLLILKQES